VPYITPNVLAAKTVWRVKTVQLASIAARKEVLVGFANKYCLTLVLILLQCPLIAQDRVNKVLPIFSEPIFALSQATGWLRNLDGQWKSRKNRIPAYLGEEYNLLQDHEKHKLGTDNFIKVELRKIKYTDSKSLLWVKQMSDGYYEYKSIEEGWIDAKMNNFWVFDKSEIDTAVYFDADSLTSLEIKCLGFNDTPLSTDVNELKAAVAQLLDARKSNVSLVFMFAVYPKKNIGRFVFFASYSNGRKSGHPRYSDGVSGQLDDAYYEVPAQTLLSMLKAFNVHMNPILNSSVR